MKQRRSFNKATRRFGADLVDLNGRQEGKPSAGAFLDGVVAASLSLMAVVTLELARSSLVDVTTVALAGISALLLLRYRFNSAWLILGGAILGIVF